MKIVSIVNQVPLCNYKRLETKKKGIVLHITSDSGHGAIQEFEGKTQKSSHYIIQKDGTVVQVVDTKYIAYHAGIVNHPTARIYFDNNQQNPNNYMIGIECESAGEPLTPEQTKSLIAVICDESVKNGFTIDRYSVIGHCELNTIDRAFDPIASYSVNDIVSASKQQAEKNEIETNWPGTVKKLQDRGDINSPDYWTNYPDVWAKKLIEKLVNKI